MAPRLKILMASGSRNPDTLLFSLKSPGKRTPSRFPNRAPMERETRLQGILHISQKPHLWDSPVKEPSLKVLFMESLAQRCPTTRALLHSSIKVPGIRAPNPTYQVPLGWKGPPWREMPAPGDFNISSRVPSEGTPPRSPLYGASSERDAPSPEPHSSIFQSPR